MGAVAGAEARAVGDPDATALAASRQGFWIFMMAPFARSLVPSLAQ